jgi:universal stress protein A
MPVISKAVELAKEYGAKLSIVHVVPNVPYYMASGLSSVSDIEDCIESSSKDKLLSLTKELSVEATTYLRHGIPKKRVVQLAKELEVDLVMVGSHGKHGVQLLLGSTASGVLHRAHCDVLLVRAKPV